MAEVHRRVLHATLVAAAAAFALVVSACGTHYHMSYRAVDVVDAFARAGFPIEQRSCLFGSDLTGAAACFDATRADVVERPGFWMDLLPNDYNGSAWAETSGKVVKHNMLRVHLGNLVLRAQLPNRDIAQIRDALAILRREHPPTNYRL